MFTSRIKIGFFCFFIVVSCNIIAATLPPSPYGNLEFEGFPEGLQVDPLLGVVDPDAPPMNLGDPCPCTIGGGCTGHLIVDPFDFDGLTCDNSNCPCQYYVEADWQGAMFLGFPIPLNNDFIAFLILGLLYATWLILKKIILKPKAYSSDDC